MNFDNILFRNVLFYLILGLGAVFIAIYFAMGRDGISKTKKKVNNFDRLLFRVIIPIILIAGAIYINYLSISDYINPGYKTGEGTLNSISYDSRKSFQFSAKINNVTYIIPNRVVKDPYSLVKGKKYNFVFTKNKVIVEINLID